MPDVLVFAQIADGALHDVSLQCLVKAKELAGDGTVSALAPGSGIGETASPALAHGADQLYLADAPELETYLTTPYAKVFKEFLKDHPVNVILMPASTAGDDLAPVLAAELDAGCVMGADDIVLKDGVPTARRMEFDRKAVCEYTAAPGKMLVATMKDGAALVGDAGEPGGAAEALSIDLAGTTEKARIVSRDVTEKSVNLKDAKVVVAVGAGVGTRENFEVVRELAQALDAEIGATRAVVDAGWLAADHQIGQTGATVRPDLYIALGISGAVQHRVGMQDAKTIIAVNTDKAAPIFKMAHYRIVGDLNEVVPKLTKLLA